MASAPVHHRPIAIAQVIKFADAATLAAIARESDQQRNADERRLLVRAIGSLPPEQALAEAPKFLRDMDPLVQAAAVRALADTNRVAAMEFLVDRATNEAPCRDLPLNAEQLVLNMSLYGAFRTLADLRPHVGSEVQTWWASNRGRMTRATPASGPDERFFSGPDQQGRVGLSVFEITFMPPAAARDFGAALERRKIKDAHELAFQVGQCVREITRDSEGVFGGTPHLPVVRLEMKTDATIGGGGLSHGHVGFAGACRITLHAALFGGDWGRTVRHELVHIIHGAHFRNQPRWLAEGLACSLSESPTKSVWLGPDRAKLLGSAPIQQMLSRGAFTNVVQWTRPVSSDRSDEGPYYVASHVAIDYLRFGPFTSPDVRLRYLMSQLDRGVRDADAIEVVYGISLAELDTGPAHWLALSR